MDVLTEQLAMALEQYESNEIPALEHSTKSSTMANLLPMAVEMHAGNIATMSKVGDEWHETTYAEFGEIVKSVAKGLIANGITIGDKVAILANTRTEWIHCDFGALTAGAVVTPIYQTNSP